LNFYRFLPIMQIRKKGGWNQKNLLLWNYWANLNQTLLKWSLGGPLSKLCLSAPSYIQDNREISTFIKNPVIYVKKLIIMLIQFKFGNFLA
jgi:hypothetical protein